MWWMGGGSYRIEHFIRLEKEVYDFFFPLLMKVAKVCVQALVFGNAIVEILLFNIAILSFLLI